MTFEEYQKQAITTLTNDHSFGDVTPELLAQVLGLVGESGEVAEKFKKIVRDKQGIISNEDKLELVKELGDILWYISAVAHLLDIDMQQVAQGNLEKVLSRKARGTTKGSGDNR